jgi:hypothetical protein
MLILIIIMQVFYRYINLVLLLVSIYSNFLCKGYKLVHKSHDYEVRKPQLWSVDSAWLKICCKGKNFLNFAANRFKKILNPRFFINILWRALKLTICNKWGSWSAHISRTTRPIELKFSVNMYLGESYLP